MSSVCETVMRIFYLFLYSYGNEYLLEYAKTVMNDKTVVNKGKWSQWRETPFTLKKILDLLLGWS